jgi:hypothetical protein
VGVKTHLQAARLVFIAATCAGQGIPERGRL